MKKIIRFLIIALSAYLLYAFIFSIIIFAFRNPSSEDRMETFTGKADDKKYRDRDRAQLVESEEDGALVRLNMIENASKSIDISYFTFRNGKFSKLMLGALVDAAERGVEVRILLDSLSSLPSLAGEFRDVLYGLDLNENIELKFYDPINPLFPFTWNKRLHDKLILVDESLALIGGRNVADNYYLKNTKWRSFSKDRDVIIFKDESLGDYDSVIKDIKSYYDRSLEYKYSKRFKRKLSSKAKVKSKLACENLKEDYIATKGLLKEELKEVNWHDYTMDTSKIVFAHNPVGKINQDPWILRELLYLSSQAEKSIFMQSPYIIPSRRIRDNFAEYDIDLKKTTLLTNSFYSSPNYLSISAYSNYRKKMVDSGVHIYEYQGKGSIHSKTYIFDDSISAIGSFNLDARSSYINSEVMIVVFSEELSLIHI